MTTTVGWHQIRGSPIPTPWDKWILNIITTFANTWLMVDWVVFRVLSRSTQVGAKLLCSVKFLCVLLGHGCISETWKNCTGRFRLWWTDFGGCLPIEPLPISVGRTLGIISHNWETSKLSASTDCWLDIMLDKVQY